ncbi:MAG: hypothetical protein ABSH20_05675 [Tepidisphaeraceae bacterium]|jgi:hypothetical protein
MRKRLLLLPAACLIAAASPHADADPFGTLGSVSSTGALGNLSSYIGDGEYITTFNTDNGQIRSSASGGFLVTTLPHTSVTEYPGGPSLNVYNFASFDSPLLANFTFIGSQPAVIAATGNISIAGHLHVAAGGGAGGVGGFKNYPTSYQNDGFPGGNAGGGSGGIGAGVLYTPSIYGGYSGGPGGGGGSVSPGQSGSLGTIQTGLGAPGPGFQNQGGAGGLAQNTAILQGAGGGGGGAGGFIPGERDSGATGGAGGGALFFITPGDFTVNLHASLSADGGAGSTPNESGGSSGGGGGGELWFDIGQIFDNEGTITALGGAGGNAHLSDVQTGLDVGGGGSGGELLIDPTEIINNGTLNVSDGLGGNLYGGEVELISPLIVNNGQIQGVAVPEPSGLVLLLPALGGLLLGRVRRAPHSA